MNLIKFLKIIYSKIIYIILLPLIMGVLVFVLTRKMPVRFASSSTVFTGVTSNSGLAVEAIRIDNVATQNEYNNIMSMLKSNNLFEEVSLKLLTQHLILTKPEREILSVKSFNELQAIVPEKVKALIVKNNFEQTYVNLKNYIRQDSKNFVYNIMNYSHKFYSIQAISNLKAERLSNSDLIKISYESEDAGICYNTVKFATDVFIEKYGAFKVSQSNSAVAYFEAKLAEIAAKLDVAEQKLLDFNIDNDVINYYEQTEQVTTQQEKIEVRLQEVKMEYEASQAVLEKLESEVEKRYNINLRNNTILTLREQLIALNQAITSIELSPNNPNSAKLPELKRNRNKVENLLENKIDSMNIFDSKSQGIESQRLLSEWLDAVKTNENYNALYKSMKIRLVEFMKQFKRYAPLGATIKRIEREIDVYEREYLNTLHHLGLARQNQQSIDMRANMNILDIPKFPITSIPSKKNLYVIISVLFTLIFYILAVFIIELLDHRLKSPSILNSKCGLDVLAAYTNMYKSNKKFIDVDSLNYRASLLVYERLLKSYSNDIKPLVVQLFSIWDFAGKTTVATLLSTEILKHNYTVQIVNFKSEPIGEKFDQSGNKDLVFTRSILDLNEKIDAYNCYDALIKEQNVNADFLLVVYPPVSNGIDNSVLVSQNAINLVVYDANSSWSDADVFMLEKLKKIIDSNKLFALLNLAEPDNLEEMYGDIPKRRSLFRKFIKTILKRIV